MKRSIRLRLLIWVLAILVPTTVIAGWLLLEAFGRRVQRDVDVALTEEAETIAELVASGGGPAALAGLVAHVAGDLDFGSGKSVFVTRDNQLLSEAPAGAQAATQRAGEDLHIVRYQASAGDVVVTVAVRQPGSRLATERLRSLLFAGVPLLIALMATGLWVAIGRVLRPLETAATALARMDPTDLSGRIPVESGDDEVGRLVTTLNATLERVEQSMSALRRFSGDAAHALRTPLTVQRTGLEVALSKDRSAIEYRQALSDALASAEQMSRIAERLLTLARLDAAATPREVGAVDIGEMLQELVDGFAITASGKDVTIELNIETTARVRGDLADLYRLFSDLIDNALRYGSRRPATIGVRAISNSDAVEISVADQGPGIDAAELSHVFERFYRGRAQRSDDGGTGLGLSIAQQIVRAHGGQIEISNRPGSGLLVTVILPAARLS